MSSESATPDGTEDGPLSLAPIGKLGFRGRRATAEERAQVMDAYFFEGKRRVPYLQQFFVLMVLSATIAAFGLANDSAAVVIGAMLVAPLMTPILGIAAAIVQGWGRRVGDSLAIVLAGAGAAILVGIAVSFLAQNLHTGLPLPGELLARTNPNMIDLGIAIAAGAAGGFVAVRTEASGALPGVGIAVALVPPLATVGMTLGLGYWDLAWGALLLFMTNLIAIVFSAGLVFVAAGFGAYRDEHGRKQAKIASIAVAIGVVVISIPLLAHSWQRVEEGQAAVAVAEGVTEWDPTMTLDGVLIDHSKEPVVVTITVAGRGSAPDATVLASRLAERWDRAVDVDVVFVPVDSGSAAAP